jgi:hypothetical protein
MGRLVCQSRRREETPSLVRKGASVRQSLIVSSYKLFVIIIKVPINPINQSRTRYYSSRNPWHVAICLIAVTLVICTVTCRRVRVTKITGSSSDVWIYWHFGYNLSLLQLIQRYRWFTQFTVHHCTRTSRILATDLNTESNTLKITMKSSCHFLFSHPGTSKLH